MHPWRVGVVSMADGDACMLAHPSHGQVYEVTSGKTLPQWLSESKKAALRKNEDYQRRLELLQDFSFPSACQRLKITPDQQYIFATGYHPPVVRQGMLCLCV